ncbi:MAG: ParB/RepB/Spo0J family partition protein [Candidatus Omnitrophota bacterium]
MGKRLGKGLGALIPGDTSKAKEKVEGLKLSDIVPNQFQPRKRFSPEKMEELLSSIREKGVIQPILVRPVEDGYELIAGERRLRAAQELSLEEIPAIIKENISDVNSLEISLIENIQRDDLNPIDEANAYQDLVDKFEYTLEKIGQMVGKDKTTVSNSLRLLALSDEVRGHLEEGAITTGHAKALLSLQSERKRKRLAKAIIKKGLSVRQVEQLVASVPGAETKRKTTKNPEVVRIEEELQHRLGTKVSVRQGKKRGRIEIQYFSNDDLQRLLRVLLQ